MMQNVKIQSANVDRDFYLETQIGKTTGRKERIYNLLRVTVKLSGEFFCLKLSDLDWSGPL